MGDLSRLVSSYPMLTIQSDCPFVATRSVNTVKMVDAESNFFDIDVEGIYKLSCTGHLPAFRAMYRVYDGQGSSLGFSSVPNRDGRLALEGIQYQTYEDKQKLWLDRDHAHPLFTIRFPGRPSCDQLGICVIQLATVFLTVISRDDAILDSQECYGNIMNCVDMFDEVLIDGPYGNQVSRFRKIVSRVNTHLRTFDSYQSMFVSHHDRVDRFDRLDKIMSEDWSIDASEGDDEVDDTEEGYYKMTPEQQRAVRERSTNDDPS